MPVTDIMVAGKGSWGMGEYQCISKIIIFSLQTEICLDTSGVLLLYCSYSNSGCIINSAVASKSNITHEIIFFQFSMAIL